MKEAAFIYASKQSKDPVIIERVIAAVEHGVSIQHLQRKPIGCPVEHAAYMYAISYPLCTEEQFRLRQAVLFGYNLITHTHYTDHSIMPFGRYQGKRMCDIPAKYFLWLHISGCKHEGVRHYINTHFDELIQTKRA